MLFTQMEPEFARRAFPCFDEPGFKAPWKLTLTIPTNCTAFANSPVREATPGTVAFETTPPLPSYLVALAVVGARSSVGRAPRLHRGGQRFESSRAHQKADSLSLA